MKQAIKIINFLGNLIVLNIIFILTSVLSLGLCLGTSLSALYASFLELKTDNNGYYIKNYFKNFKINFKNTFIYDLCLILLLGAGYLNFLMINTFNNDALEIFSFAIIALIGIEVAFITSFYFPVCAKFEGDILHHLYLAFVFAHRYFYLSFLFIILFVASIYLILYVSLAFITIIFGLVIFFESFLLKKIWKEYTI